MNANLKNIIERIDELKVAVDSLRPMNFEQEQKLMQKIRLDWNYHSNSLEGNSLNYGETKALILFGVTAEGKPLRDHLEIRGHNEAIEYIIEIVKNNDIDISETFIRQLHQIIIPEDYYSEAFTPDGIPTRRLIKSGAYKSAPNHVKTVSGEVFYFASPEETPAKMQELMNWYRRASADESIHPLVLSALFHYNFVRIHPFDDGNGRMSRLLMNFILMKKRLVPLIITTESKSEYYQALQYADADDIDKFCAFLGERLIESLELWLRAAKGESITESNDIDKMVAVLKRKIEWNGLDKEAKIEKNSETVFEVFNLYICPFLIYFNTQIAKFESLFKVREFRFYLHDSEDEYFESNSVDQFIGILRIHQSDEIISLYNSTQCIFNLSELIPNNSLNIKVELAFNFEQFYYSVCVNSEEKLRKRYHQPIANDEIDDIVNPIISSIYKQINDEIDESNKVSAK